MSDVLPPGINTTSPFKFYASSGDEKEWLPFTKIKDYTNAFIVQEGKLLLGYKKRGFGQGKYNGFGGKVEPGETSLQAAIRELQEESGVLADLEHAGSLFFLTKGADFAFQIDIYRAESFTGIITESDEMRPEWFSTSNLPTPTTADEPEAVGSKSAHASGGDQSSLLPLLPLAQMWDTDRVWLPLLVSKRKFFGRADFTQEGDVYTPVKWWYGVPLAGEMDG